MLPAPGDQVVLQGNLYRRDNDQERFALIRLNPDGTRDESFRSPAFGQSPVDPNPASVSTIAWATDDRLLVGGQFTLADGQPRSGLAKLLSDGHLDPAFVVTLEIAVPGMNGPGQVTRMAVQSDGRIVIAGDFTSVQGASRRGLARLMADGSLDATFDPGTGFSMLFSNQQWRSAATGGGENRYRRGTDAEPVAAGARHLRIAGVERR